MMDALERVNLALKVLYRRKAASKSEIGTLKSYLGGDATHMSVEEVASEVIQRELSRHKAARRKIAPARN